ncbi:MAG: FtsX-like permease family protein [Rhodothermales bacterium]|nr:FtsX-like permease family protein [Rhodothermales bacterium]
MTSWVPRFAWRDTRGSRRKLLLFVSSMVLGVAALVSINSFGDNLQTAVDEQARTLLGADLSFESDGPFPDSVEVIIDTLTAQKSRRVSFSSMALFPEQDISRLATVRAHQPGYPWYGQIVTEPAEAAATYLEGRNALVDGTLMRQLGAEVGDSVRIGRIDYRITGRLLQTPRESAAVMLFSPRVYIPYAYMDTTLFGVGSRAEWEVYFKFDDGRDFEAMNDTLESTLRGFDVSTDTVREEQEGWDEALTNLYRFLGLVGFMALLLGSLGVASSIHVYVRRRIATVAVLRCFGASSWSTFRVYMLQAGAMGLFGAFVGSLIGVALQLALPAVLADFLPVDVEFAVSWPAVFTGAGVGVAVTLLFALMPLLAIRDISPLAALRSEVETVARPNRDPARWITYGFIGAALVGFAVLQAPFPMAGVVYAASIGAVFLILAGIAKVLIRLLRRLKIPSMPYVFRQGIANLYRPHNQTLVMILSLGVGSFLVMTMVVSEDILLNQVNVIGEGDRPNLIFYDVQKDQVDDLTRAISDQGHDIYLQSPLISMRIHAIGDRTVEELRADSTFDMSWAHRREYRSTYRDHLTDTETLVDGELVAEWSGDGPVPVSIEQDIMDDLRVTLGDRVTFDVQGRLIETEIASVRTVDWRRMQTNFFFVFPEGVLERAPSFHVVMTRAETEEASADLQTSVTRLFPNVSSIDITLVLGVFEAIFSRIAFVVRFMALFSILTGLIVLAGAVLVSRFQRVEESVLLKTLGGSKSTVIRIMTVEYVVLGIAAAVTGMILSLTAGWALARFLFDTDFVVDPVSLLLVVLGVVGLTVLIGFLNSRGVYGRQALEVLRSDV